MQRLKAVITAKDSLTVAACLPPWAYVYNKLVMDNSRSALLPFTPYAHKLSTVFVAAYHFMLGHHDRYRHLHTTPERWVALLLLHLDCDSLPHQHDMLHQVAITGACIQRGMPDSFWALSSHATSSA